MVAYHKIEIKYLPANTTFMSSPHALCRNRRVVLVLGEERIVIMRTLLPVCAGVI